MGQFGTTYNELRFFEAQLCRADQTELQPFLKAKYTYSTTSSSATRNLDHKLALRDFLSCALPQPRVAIGNYVVDLSVLSNACLLKWFFVVQLMLLLLSFFEYTQSTW